MKVKERKLAIKLRKQGKSINQIVKETKSAKSSVSLWVRDVVLTDAQKNKISKNGRSVASVEKRRLSRLKNESLKKRAIIDEAKKDFCLISMNDLKIAGVMLYLGEGSKTGHRVAIANSDPEVIKLAMKFFRNICNVPENKFRAHIHTFQNANVEETEKYWSKIIGVPLVQFYKTYKKPSRASKQKRKTLPFGTLEVSINDTKLFLKIMGWIEKLKELIINDI